MMTLKKETKKSSKTDITYDIKEVYGYLNDEKTLIYASIAWNGNPAKDEVRRIALDDNGDIKYLGKGIAIDTDEIKNLHKLSKMSHPDPVNFTKIFDQAPDIISGRQKGYQTEDGGFMKLLKK